MIDIITRGRQRCDQENRDVLSAAEWKANFSTCWGEFYSILVESGLRYFESEDTITTTASTSTYALPSDHLTTIGVDRLVNSTTGQRYELKQLMAQSRNAYTSLGGASESWAWAMVGSNIKLYPTPPAGQTYYHVYVPQPTDYSSSDDSVVIDVVTPDGEAFLIYSLAAYGAMKEESDASLFQQEREAARARVQNWATLRALNEPRVRVVVDDYEGRNAMEGDFDY